jgi:predicted HNH restriction endonuclease
LQEAEMPKVPALILKATILDGNVEPAPQKPAKYLARNVRGSEAIYPLEAKKIKPACSIRVLCEVNPKQEGSAARLRFARYLNGQTVAAYCAAVGAEGRNDLVWDFNRGYIDIVPPESHLLADFEQYVRVSLNNDPAKRRERLANAPRIPELGTVTSQVFIRNPDVVAEVLSRARGHCEFCGNAAPFQKRRDGEPYLEIHHLKMLADGGEDTVENAKAACPNCHRKEHYG